jgi:ribose 5-phosphate isomerase A
MEAETEREKRVAAAAAASLVEDGMRVGLGTGSTVAYLLSFLAERQLRIDCVATSPVTQDSARRLGLTVLPFIDGHLDIAIDGADQVDPRGWLVKGGGGAHTREKLVAAAARQFFVIVDSSKLVASLHPPVPLELLSFGVETTIDRLGNVGVRDMPPSPDGGLIADCLVEFDDPEVLSNRLKSTIGVIEHGLFPPSMVTAILVGHGAEVERIDIGNRP